MACKTTSIRTNGLAESAQFTSTTVRTTKASQEPAPTDAVALKFTPTRLAGPTEARNTVTASPSPKQPPAGLTLDELNTYKECEALEKQNLPLIPQCGFISEERWGAGPEEERLAQLVARSTVNGKVSQDLLYQNLREERQRTAKETAMAYVPDPSDVTGVSQAITGMAGAAGGALFRAAGTRATQSSPGTSKPTAVQTATTADTRSVTRGQELREKYSQLSAEQRNHIIQDSKATDFGRIADSIDVRSDGHSRKRHGIVTTEQQQVTRATTGLTPDGVQGRKVDSSRFVSDEMLVKAVQKAEARRSPNIMETPDHRLTIDVDMGETAGEVWKKGTGEYLGTTSVVRVRFDDETGHPYTAYPIMKDRREQ